MLKSFIQGEKFALTRFFLVTFPSAFLLSCTTSTHDVSATAAPTAGGETTQALVPPAESGSRPLPRYCEDRNAAELLVATIVVPCVIRSHPLQQVLLRNQDDRFPEQRPIGMFERRLDAAMVTRDAAGGELGFTGIMIASASGAGSFYMLSEDGRIRCSGESNIREGTGTGTCTNGQRLSHRFAPQGVRANGHVVGQQEGGQGLIVFGWGQDASLPVLRGRLQNSG